MKSAQYLTKDNENLEWIWRREMMKTNDGLGLVAVVGNVVCPTKTQ